MYRSKDDDNREEIISTKVDQKSNKRKMKQITFTTIISLFSIIIVNGSKCNWTLSSNWKRRPIVHDQQPLQLNSTPVNAGKDNGGYELENYLLRDEYLQSPDFHPPKSEAKYFCFDFDYYFMNDGRHNNQNYVTLYLIESNDEEKKQKLWSTPMLFGDFWHHTYVRFQRPSSSTFKLKFNSDSYGGLMAVKDFHLQYDDCPKIGNFCDFETTNCDWRSSWEGGIKMRRALALYTTYPKHYDHTTFSSFGYEMYGKSLPIYDTNATLTNTVMGQYLDPKQQQCFQFWLWINGPTEYVQLSLYQLSSSDTVGKQLWNLSATQQMAEQWNRFQVDLNFDKLSILQFRVKLGIHFEVIKFDDFNLIPGRCPERISCDFLHHNTCGWKNHLDISNQNQSMWSFGLGRVKDATKLTFLKSVKNFIPHTTPVLYTDFTTLPVGNVSQMEMFSEVIDDGGVPKSGACIRMNYEVWSFDANTDSFGVYYQTFVGKNETRQKEIWRFNSSKRGNDMAIIPLSYAKGEVFRLIIVAKSAQSSTYITVNEIKYSIKTSANDDCSR
ncbi:hypothetical protein BLA29_002720 [Euroglyphus maynei]|uniref:MAM domain-containing protein n=1 Tax=Euroglyphus maynei TaxID=6958 RepID=A0A1Y3AQG5_EURMA|nr:hypothetical protein BLA29_002720 [Euroglyphus maynei]